MQRVRSVLEFTPHSWLSEKLHGNIFQCGLPDTVFITPEGQCVWIEFKMAERFSLALLQGRQRLVCLRWAMRGVPVFVVGQGSGLWYADLRHYENATCSAPMVTRPAEAYALLCASLAMDVQ